jgi:molybdopterin-containing oxidoreductase family membrane subunit
MAYLLLAGLSTPLVLSVHSIVSFDFAVSLLPGWHATIFPPYFVAGAVFAGFAMVLTLMIPLRISYKLRDLVTMHHLDNMAKVMLATGLIVAYGYAMEMFTAWYSGNLYERFVLLANRVTGPYWLQYASLILCNVLVPQALWFPAVRRSPFWLFVIAMFVNVGMWLERFVIIVGSLHRDFLPSSWGMYTPSFWDVSLFVGTIGMFLTFIFLFVRVLPFISIAEMKHLIWHSAHHGDTHDTGHTGTVEGKGSH